MTSKGVTLLRCLLLLTAPLTACAIRPVDDNAARSLLAKMPKPLLV
jgi:hypothetical protein